MKTQYTGKVTEDSIIGSLAYTHDNIPLLLLARASDSQENALLHFEIVEPYASGAFIIDTFSGKIVYFDCSYIFRVCDYALKFSYSFKSYRHMYNR